MNLENEYNCVSDCLLGSGIVNKWNCSYPGVHRVLQVALGEVERLMSLGSQLSIGDNPT